MKYIRIFFGSILLVISLSSCAFKEKVADYYNQEGIKAFKSGEYEKALTDFQKATGASTERKDIFALHQADTEYNLGNYKDAGTSFSKLEMEYCTKESVYCADLHYNFGNTLYKIGEEETEIDKKASLWQDAIKQYSKTLSFNAKDTFAKENREFVRKKLEELRQKQQKDEGKQDTSSSSEQESNKQQNSQRQSNNTSSTNSQGKSQEQSNSSQPNTMSSEKKYSLQNTDGQNEELTPEMKDQIDGYEKDMIVRQKMMQKYNRPEANNQNTFPSFPFMPFGNNPFFNNFFGHFPNIGNNNEKDW